MKRKVLLFNKITNGSHILSSVIATSSFCCFDVKISSDRRQILNSLLLAGIERQKDTINIGQNVESILTEKESL